MKNLLSILGTIGLTATSTTSLIACDKPKSDNNSENGAGNKPEPTPKPQQPPKDSNWKLIDDVWEEVKQSSNKKWYIGIYYTYVETDDDKYWVIEKFNNIKKIKTNYWDEVYRWDGNGEPQTPEINNGGEIIDWKEQKD